MNQRLGSIPIPQGTISKQLNPNLFNSFIDNVTKDDFKIEKVVGKGGFGTVYLVVHKYTE